MPPEIKQKKMPAQNCCFAEKVGTERPRRSASQSRGQMGGTVPLGRDPVARTHCDFWFPHLSSDTRESCAECLEHSELRHCKRKKS
ncbi:hypothetical protein N5P37_002489 [Trichoderma harzianum]|nr:hypothetical protein N5P37_002489 [Trichoderma harzianum]